MGVGSDTCNLRLLKFQRVLVSDFRRDGNVYDKGKGRRKF